MGRRLGDPADPLLVSRALRREVLDARDDGDRPQHRPQRRVGAAAWPRQSDDERFALDSYRRLLQMFGSTVLGIDAERLRRRRSTRLKDEPGTARTTSTSTPTTCATLVGDVQGARSSEHAGRGFPQDPREQLDLAVRAVFDSWNTDRAPCSTAARSGSPRTSAPRSTSRRWSSATAARPPAPASLHPRPGDRRARACTATTCRTPRARTSSPASATPCRWPTSRELDQASHDELIEIMATLEQPLPRHVRHRVHHRAAASSGCCRPGSASARPRRRSGSRTHMVDEGLIDLDEALRRVTGAQLAQLMFPRFDDQAERDAARHRHERLPRRRRRQGRLRLRDRRASGAERGEDVILVRKETNPDDLRGMVAARGILTSRGGKTSHAAVVARGMGRTCVCGAEALDVDVEAPAGPGPRRPGHPRGRRDLHRRHHRRGLRRRGAGRRLRGRAPLRGRDGRRRPGDGGRRAAWTTPTASAGCGCARTPTPRRTPPAPAGSAPQGIGLCRTEHMFLGDRRELVENLIVAEDEDGAGRGAGRAAAAAARGLHRDPRGDGRAAGDDPADRPAAARVPARPHRAVGRGGAGGRARRDRTTPATSGCSPPSARLHEQNPMLGLRGVRLGIVDPRAVRDAGPGDPRGRGRPDRGRRRPAAGDHDPAGGQRARARRWCGPRSSTVAERGRGASAASRVPHQIGTMIELPRAALTADRIAGVGRLLLLRHQRPHPDDLGLLARRRRGGVLLGATSSHGIFAVSPFESLDTEGVGGWSRLRPAKGRATRPDLTLGVCGEHGGDPRVDPLLRRRRARLRLVLAVPGAGGPARGRALGAGWPRARRSRLRRAPRRGPAGRAARAGRRCRRPRTAPSRCSRACVALVAGGTPDQLDQPVERVVDVAAEQVEVGHHGLGVDVVGGRGRGLAGRAGGRRPGCAAAASAIASPAAASASAGLASTSFWYSATAASMSPASSASWAAA